MFAHRRAIAVDGGPSALDATSRPYDGRRDVQFTDVRFTLGSRRVALWTMTLRNTNPRVAYRDVTYLTTYRDQRGEIVEQRSHYIEDIFQPGAAETIGSERRDLRAGFRLVDDRGARGRSAAADQVTGRARVTAASR